MLHFSWEALRLWRASSEACNRPLRQCRSCRRRRPCHQFQSCRRWSLLCLPQTRLRSNLSRACLQVRSPACLRPCVPLRSRTYRHSQTDFLDEIDEEAWTWRQDQQSRGSALCCFRANDLSRKLIKNKLQHQDSCYYICFARSWRPITSCSRFCVTTFPAWAIFILKLIFYKVKQYNVTTLELCHAGWILENVVLRVVASRKIAEHWSAFYHCSFP